MNILGAFKKVTKKATGKFYGSVDLPVIKKYGSH